MPIQRGGWLLPDRAIQEREQGGGRGAFHALLPKGAAVTSASLSPLKRSHEVQPPVKRRGSRYHLLKGGATKNFRPPVKTTRAEILINFRIC